MSLVELWREFAIGYEKRRHEHDRDIFVAWHAAAFVWSKKLPKLEEVMSKRPKPMKGGKAASEHSQSAGEQKAVLNILSAIYGYPLRKTVES